ncbi:hypothetical protein M1O47_01100 [Dehalococcoidia bacterium]|nr:hypothetical protein [Dehalococcoidia bacterium]
MRGYDFDIKVFALDRRGEGRGWGEIKQAIRERFNIKPPSTRSLQKWEKELDRNALNRALMEKAKREAEGAKGEALTRAAEDLLPNLWKARDAGEDIEYAGWRWFFSIIEATLGSEKFRKFFNQYMEEQAGKPDLPPTPLLKSERRP